MTQNNLYNFEKWNDWNQSGGPNYPHDKVIQFCLRNYPPQIRNLTRVLDLGCGTGANTWFLSREGFLVTATDISPNGIDATKRRLDQSELIAQLRVEGANEISDKAESFDLVICVGVLEAVGASVAKEVFEKVSRVLKTGGNAFFLFASNEDFRIGPATNYNLYGYSETEVLSLLPAGFRSVLLDQYVTTYGGGNVKQSDWILTCGK